MTEKDEKKKYILHGKSFVPMRKTKWDLKGKL